MSQAFPPTQTGPSSQPPSEASPTVSALRQWILPVLTAGLLILVIYQQSQITQLNQAITNLDDTVKGSEIKSKLASQEQSLDNLNQRLVYLDSKINATNQTAQEALKRIQAHEDKDVVGKWMDGIKQTFGLR